MRRFVRARTAASETPRSAAIWVNGRRPSCWRCSMIRLSSSDTSAPEPAPFARARSCCATGPCLPRPRRRATRRRATVRRRGDARGKIPRVATAARRARPGTRRPAPQPGGRRGRAGCPAPAHRAARRSPAHASAPASPGRSNQRPVGPRGAGSGVQELPPTPASACSGNASRRRRTVDQRLARGRARRRRRARPRASLDRGRTGADAPPRRVGRGSTRRRRRRRRARHPRDRRPRSVLRPRATACRRRRTTASSAWRAGPTCSRRR